MQGEVDKLLTRIDQDIAKSAKSKEKGCSFVENICRACKLQAKLTKMRAKEKVTDQTSASEGCRFEVGES